MENITKLSDLKEAEYNPREIDKRALEGLKYSLEEFGDISGIVYNKRTGRLVSGHQRVKALRQRYGDVNVINGVIITSAGDFPVRVVDWEEDKEKAANLAANTETIQGRWTESASIVLEDVAISMPDAFMSLQLNHITLPEPDQVIEVEKQSSEITQEQRSSLKWTDHTVYLADEEIEMLNSVYKKFIEINRTNFGFVTYLLGGK